MVALTLASILVGKRSAVVRILHLIEELGPHLGLFINYP